MASITSLSNSSYNTSSIYGNRNVLSGLASGMDTETMIENAVSGYKMKIENLVKKRTKVEWQQEAYRSIIDKAVNFNNKYTSYSSKTNLLSQSFFTNAVNTTTAGKYADKITASGKSSSDIKINGVKQLAKAAAYTVSGLSTPLAGSNGSVQAAKGFDIEGTTPVSTVAGSLSFQYGGSNGTIFDIKFDELENLNEVKVYNEDGTEKTDANNGEKLAQAINNKLSEISYSYTKNGVQENTTADKVVKVEADALGNISLSDALGEGNKVSICYVSGDMKDTLGISKGDTSIRGNQALTKDVDTRDFLADKELGITLNGTTKKIKLADVVENSKITDDDPEGTDANQKFVQALQDELDDAFGSGKVTASYEDGKLSFAPKGEGNTLSVSGSVVESMGFENGDSNYINAGKKLSDLVGEDLFKKENRLKGEFDEGAEPTLSKNGTYYLDSKGNRVDKEGYRLSSDDKYLYDFQINGAHINVTEDTTLESLMNSINSNAEAGVKVSYSQLTNEFKFTATETGANSKIEFDGMAKDLFAPTGKEVNHNFAKNYGFPSFPDSVTPQITVKFDSKELKFRINNQTTMQDFADEINKAGMGDLKASYNEETGQFTVTDRNGVEKEFAVEVGGTVYDRKITPLATYTAGQDAVMDVEINGKRFENLTRSGNSFSIDGMTINVKDTFETAKDEEPVTFKTATDSDKIVDAIRSFVEDYNEMATEIKNAYSTLPAQKSNGARYEPLTAEQEDEYSESELKAYNEKAKQGILFGDTTLSGMYSKLLSSIQPGGTDGQTLREIGIGTSYSDGMTTLSLDEDKLRAALDSDPDKVRNAFAKTQEGGSATNGMMQTMQNALNSYVKTAGEPKGVLIARAGSVKSPTSLNSNSLQSQMNNIDNEIERWQDKMANQIDRYTTQFSRLEQLIAQMNSQASAMSGLMGGSGGY